MQTITPPASRSFGSFVASYQMPLLCAFSALLFAYGTMIYRDFLVLDDAQTLADVYEHTTTATTWGFIIGRPITALYVLYTFTLFNSVPKLPYIRIITLLTLMTCFVPWFALLRRFVTGFAAGVIATCTFLLLPFVISVMWPQVASYPLAFLASSVAACLIERELNKAGDSLNWGALLVPILLVATALYTDQPAAQVVFCLPGLYCLGIRASDDFRRTFRCFWVTCVVFAIAGVLYFGSWQAYKAVLFPDVNMQGRIIVSTLAQAEAKAAWFLTVLREAGHLYFLSDWWAVSIAVYSVIALYFVTRRVSLLERAGRLALWVALLPATYAANLMTQESWSEFRTQYSIQAYLWMSVCVAIYGLAAELIARRGEAARRIAAAASCSMVLFLVARQAFFVGPALVAPHAAEYDVMRSAMAEFERERGAATRLVLLRSNWDALAPAWIRYDLIGTPATTAPWAAIPMARVAYWADFKRHLPLPVIDVAFGDAASFKPEPSDYVMNLDTILRTRARFDASRAK